MLRTAVDMVHRVGLTVSLEHISFEEVIHEAGVARSAVYRRWPYKDLFFSDLLKELAKAAAPAAVVNESQALTGIRRIVLERLDTMLTPEGRHELALELYRQAALGDFEAMRASTEWRTYLALHATFVSLADEALRTEVRAALVASEQDFIARIAKAHELMAGILGYRLRPELGATFETLAVAASATLRGKVLMALSTPAIATERLRARPFGAAEAADWSLPALVAASIAFGFLEPDPAIEWNTERLAWVRDQLHEV
ncbi:hypothetical protein GCM10027569_77280 [Flindersiella endophytica]